MASYTDWSSLEAAVQRKMRSAMKETFIASEEDVAQNQQSFYTQQRQPHFYERTGAFGNSYRAEYIGDFGNTSEAKIYLDYGYNYARQGISTHEIFIGAQSNLHYISGKAGTWDKTLMDIDKNIKRCFGKYFK